MDNKPDIQVISIPGDRYPVQLKISLQIIGL